METSIVCPVCKDEVTVDVPLGASIFRTQDRALVDHYNEVGHYP